MFGAAEGVLSAGRAGPTTPGRAARASRKPRSTAIRRPASGSRPTLEKRRWSVFDDLWRAGRVGAADAGRHDPGRAAGQFLPQRAAGRPGIRKLTERYNEYLKEQEKLLAEGKLDEAERGRVEFQRNIMTKYVGAPLLGAFSVAAGASMIGARLSGATVSACR